MSQVIFASPKPQYRRVFCKDKYEPQLTDSPNTIFRNLKPKFEEQKFISSSIKVVTSNTTLIDTFSHGFDPNNAGWTRWIQILAIEEYDLTFEKVRNLHGCRIAIQESQDFDICRKTGKVAIRTFLDEIDGQLFIEHEIYNVAHPRTITPILARLYLIDERSQ